MSYADQFRTIFVAVLIATLLSPVARADKRGKKGDRQGESAVTEAGLQSELMSFTDTYTALIQQTTLIREHRFDYPDARGATAPIPTHDGHRRTHSAGAVLESSQHHHGAARKRGSGVASASLFLGP